MAKNYLHTAMSFILQAEWVGLYTAETFLYDPKIYVYWQIIFP